MHAKFPCLHVGIQELDVGRRDQRLPCLGDYGAVTIGVSREWIPALNAYQKWLDARVTASPDCAQFPTHLEASSALPDYLRWPSR